MWPSCSGRGEHSGSVHDDSAVHSDARACWLAASLTIVHVLSIAFGVPSVAANARAHLPAASMIRQRIRAGLRRAVEAGKQLGRPKIKSRPGKTNQESIAGRQGHVDRRQGARRRHEHCAARCERNGSSSPFKRRKRGRVKGRRPATAGS
jgi:hypothetical protein